MRSDPLTTLPSPEDQAMLKAVRLLVDRKHALDDACVSGRHQWLVPNFLRTMSGTTVDSHGFFHAVMPFSSMESSGTIYARVPADLVLGESHAWRFEDLTHADRDRLLEKLSSADRANRQHGDCAEYTWVKALGLFIAGEGKNRVRFLRAMKQRHIPAIVTVRDYPAAERIGRYKVRLGGRDECWAVLDDRWVKQLYCYEASAPLMDAYGIRGEQSWPSRWPAPETVLSAFDDSYRRSRSSFNGAVDLVQLGEQRAKQQAIVQASFIELAGIRRDWSPVIKVAFFACLIFVGSALTPYRWLDLLGSVTLGGALGFCAALVHPWLRVPRRML